MRGWCWRYVATTSPQKLAEIQNGSKEVRGNLGPPSIPSSRNAVIAPNCSGPTRCCPITPHSDLENPSFCWMWSDIFQKASRSCRHVTEPRLSNHQHLMAHFLERCMLPWTVGDTELSRSLRPFSSCPASSPPRCTSRPSLSPMNESCALPLSSPRPKPPLRHPRHPSPRPSRRRTRRLLP